MKKSVLTFLLLFAFLTPAHSIILFESTFDGPSLPPEWSFDSDGSWSIIDGQLDQSVLTAPGHADAWAGDFNNWTDYSVEMRFRLLEFGTHNMEAGLGLRHTQAGSGGGGFVTRVSWRGTSWNIEAVKTGEEIHIALNQNLTTNTWYTMKSQIEGDLLKVWVNDILYDFGDISESPYLIPSAGNIGLWSNEAHVRFDDVIVRSLSDPIPEPMSLSLLGLGLFGVGMLRKKKG